MENPLASRLIAAAIAAVLTLSSCGSESEGAAAPAELLVCDTQLSEIVEILQSGLPTYDYDPFPSLESLVVGSEVVAFGMIDALHRDVDAEGWSVMQVSAVEVVQPPEFVGEISKISWSSWWADRSARDPLEDSVEFADVEFVAFLTTAASPGGLTPHIQGLAISCAGDAGLPTPILEPLPAAGRNMSLDELRDAVRSIAMAEAATLGTPLDGPVMRYPVRSETNEGEGAEIFGVVQVEGECLYLAMEEPVQRFPVVWPAGTMWDPDSQLVTLPNGDQVGLTDEVYGGGGYGYIDSVKTLLGRDAAALAERCVDNEYGEIAMVNNSDDAIGRR